jgi:hypothetical protein
MASTMASAKLCPCAITEKGLRLATPEESPPKYARAGQDAGTPQPALAGREGLALRDVSLGAQVSGASQSRILGRQAGSLG